MKLSRREIAGLAATPLLAQVTLAQVAPSTPAVDLAKAARDANQRNSETLAKFQVPIATEPAYQFKA